MHVTTNGWGFGGTVLSSAVNITRRTSSREYISVMNHEYNSLTPNQGYLSIILNV